jgi:hypothetical protein
MGFLYSLNNLFRKISPPQKKMVGGLSSGAVCVMWSGYVKQFNKVI